MARRTPRPQLTAEQSADADRLHAALVHAVAGDLRHLAEQLATTTDRTLFGANEFAVRDIVLGLANALQVALDDREKKVTTGAVAGAPPAVVRPSSSGGSPAPSSPSSATCD